MGDRAVEAMYGRRAGIEAALKKIPGERALTDRMDAADWGAVADLMDRCAGSYAGLPRVTKVIHKKRPRSFPSLISGFGRPTQLRVAADLGIRERGCEGHEAHARGSAGMSEAD